jgi:phage host-nuclease inhibitor protein Gam
MKIAKTLRTTMAAGLIYALVVTSVPVPAHAASKEIIELQTQVQQLMDMVQRLQSTVDTRMGVMQHLVEQTADNANQMNATINALQLKINGQTEATGGKLDTVSGQVQSLNDSVDELKTRLAKLDKSLSDMQAQLQNIQTPPQPAPGSQILVRHLAGPHRAAKARIRARRRRVGAVWRQEQLRLRPMPRRR